MPFNRICQNKQQNLQLQAGEFDLNMFRVANVLTRNRGVQDSFPVTKFPFRLCHKPAYGWPMDPKGRNPTDLPRLNIYPQKQQRMYRDPFSSKRLFDTRSRINQIAREASRLSRPKTISMCHTPKLCWLEFPRPSRDGGLRWG